MVRQGLGNWQEENGYNRDRSRRADKHSSPFQTILRTHTQRQLSLNNLRPERIHDHSFANVGDRCRNKCHSYFFHTSNGVICTSIVMFCLSLSLSLILFFSLILTNSDRANGQPMRHATSRDDRARISSSRRDQNTHTRKSDPSAKHQALHGLSVSHKSIEIKRNKIKYGDSREKYLKARHKREAAENEKHTFRELQLKEDRREATRWDPGPSKEEMKQRRKDFLQYRESNYQLTEQDLNMEIQIELNGQRSMLNWKRQNRIFADTKGLGKYCKTFPALVKLFLIMLID